jgi:hypothetical protein
MHRVKPAVAAVLLAVGAAAGFATAPVAAADDDICDPTATVCQGSVQTDTNPPAAAPSVVAPADEYPYDGDWYFNPAGGGTELQPNHPSGGGSASGGGGHR